MKNLIVNVSRETRMVTLPKQFIAIDGENLQSKLVFTFIDEFVDGQARLEYEINGEKNYILLSKENDTYSMLVKNVMTKEGQIDMQLVITEGTNEEEIPVFKSNKFYLYCNSSINAVEEAPDGYELWIEQANVKLNQIDNIDIDLKDNVLTITKKDGTQISENVKGETGPEGPAGPEGPEGPEGPKGETALTVNVGSVETVDFDTPASVTNVGTDKDLILDFKLPKGKDGYTPVKGKDYFDGEKGDTYTITDRDYQEIANVVEKDIKPTLDGNLKSAKDYTDNAIIRDFKDISYNENTATFVFTRHDNTTFSVDLPIEQTVKNGYYDDKNKELVLVLVSDQEIKIPASGLIDDYDGLTSATIQCVVSSDNKITCNIISGSISKTLLTTELQQEINNKVNNDTFTTELTKKVNTADVGEEQYTITYGDGSTKTIKAVVWK